MKWKGILKKWLLFVSFEGVVFVFGIFIYVGVLEVGIMFSVENGRVVVMVWIEWW